ncbi:MAG: TonB-dependent receptor [Verrucomicrobiota bacterium]|jgi:iron complex outermembrane receptor protein|nr:TonB-dependent receptor [Verrucomicrobiota bacterium]
MKKTVLLSAVLPCLIAHPAAADGDTNAPPASLVIRVEAFSLAPTARPGPSLLRDVPGLSVRDQGAGGPQADLSIRGSPFNSTGLLLNGLTLRNAQTEHWHADVPAPEVWFGPPDVLTGLDRFRIAPGHPSGSVSLDLAPMTENLRSVTAGAGNKGVFFGNALVTETQALDGGGTAGASGFLSFDRADQTDGYRDNDLTRAAAGGRVGVTGDALQGDLLTAFSWRTFGARSFYGTDAKYPAEERKSDALVAGTLRFTEDPLNPARLSAAWLRTEDTYWLDRNNHASYENEHTTDLIALHGDTRRTFSETFSLDLRADTDLETIDSSSLGDHTRTHASLAALPNLATGPLTWTLGGSIDLFSDDDCAWLPAAGVEWALSDIHTLFLTYTEAVREPSYTELNYESPSSLGNNGLDRQRTRTAEAGWRGQTSSLAWRTTLFYEKGENIVDWLRRTPGGRWESINLDDIETWGLAADGRLTLTGDTDIGLDVLALAKDCDTDFYASRYAVDYPDFEAGATLRHRFTRDLLLRLRQGVSKYASNRARANDDWFVNTCAEIQWRLPRVKGVTLNAGIDNLLDDDFQLYPGQESAGRRFFASLAYTW